MSWTCRAIDGLADVRGNALCGDGIRRLRWTALAIGMLTFAISRRRIPWLVGGPEGLFTTSARGLSRRDQSSDGHGCDRRGSGLGLLVASAKSSYDAKDAAVRQVGVQIIVLDRTLAEYGPETKEIRSSLRELVTTRMQGIWPASKGQDRCASIAKGPGVEVIQRQLLALAPQNDAQRWRQSTACKSVATQPRGDGWRCNAPAVASNGHY